MATSGRPSNTDLIRRRLPDLLVDEPYRFDFFQAVRLLDRLMPESVKIGSYANPAAEAVRFQAHPSLAFPASEIQALTFREGAPPAMMVNFMGLTGPLGVLPSHYTELLRERTRLKDTALRDFLDIFNHRLISLFYLAWEKHRPAVTFEQAGEDAFCRRLYCFLGMGTPGLRQRREIPDESLIFQGGLLMMHTRPAVALESVLREYFGVPATVEQFVGAWQKIEPDALCHLGDERYSESLGVGSVIGDEIWDAQSGVRVRLGPLTLEQYRSFMPGGTAHGQLGAWLSYFAGLEFNVELQLVLARREVPACELAAGAEGPQLGWTSWMKSEPFRRDADDLVFELN